MLPTLSGNPMSTVGLSSQLDAMMAADPYLTSSLAPVLGATVPQAQGVNAATNALQGYQGTLGAAGGPQGPVSGLLSQLGGLFTGGPAAQVGPQQAETAALLARILGITPQQAMGMLPGLTANQAGASAAFGAPTSILSSLQ